MASQFTIDDDNDDTTGVVSPATTMNTSNVIAPPPQPPPMVQLIGPDGQATAYHPDFMFCGECATCDPQQLNTSEEQKDEIANMKELLPRESVLFAHKIGDEEDYVDNNATRRNGSVVDGDDDTGSNDGSTDDNNNKVTIRTKLIIENFHDESQILVIKSLLHRLDGIINVTTKQTTNTVIVNHDTSSTSVDKIIETLRTAGFLARLHGDNPTSTQKHLSELKLCRSEFYVDGICCASEVPAIRKILKPLNGINKIQINITTKHVYVHHNSTLITAPDISSKLEKDGFPARIIKDGSPTSTDQDAINNNCGDVESPSPNATNSNNNSNIYAPNVGRTTIHIESVITQKDIPKIQEILTKLSTGVKRIGVNIAESVVYIEHDVGIISAKQIQAALEGKDPNELCNVHGNKDPPASTKTPSSSNKIGMNTYQTTLAADAQDDINERNTSAIQSIARSKYVESTLILTNLTLKHIPLIEKCFKQNFIRPQVRAFYPHVPSNTIKIEHNPNLLNCNKVCNLLKQYGLEASIAIDGSIENLALPLMEDYSNDKNNAAANNKNNKKKNNPYYGSGSNIRQIDDNDDLHKYIHLNVILSGIFWFISLLSVIGGKWEYLEYAGIISVLFGLPPIAKKAYRTIKRCQFDANCMMVTAAIGALALQEYDEAASVAFLFAVSEYLEARATSKARKALSAIVSLRPDHANVIHPTTKEIVVVPADKVPIGSLISVRTGDKIAADGIVVEGTSTVDESSLTGEAIPIMKRVSQTVSGGSINIGTTQLIIRTTSTVDDSAVSRLIKLVEEAQANRSPTEKLIDSFAKKYTPIVVLMAGLMCTIPWLWGRDVGRYWTLNGLIIIVIACPCALTISTPVTYAAALAATAQRGVIVKGGARLEALGSVEKVVFDKTGTLTQGKFSVIHLDTISNPNNKEEEYTRSKVLELLALMEAPSSHPLSSTLVSAAKKEGIKVNYKDYNITEHTILKGEGITAIVNGKNVYVGNKRLFERVNMLHTLPSDVKISVEEWNSKGGTVGFIGVEGVGVIGTFCVMDAIREESKDVVGCLHDGGIDVLMCTGDGDGAAKAVGKQIGISESNIHSQLLPEDKLHFIGSLKGGGSSSRRGGVGGRVGNNDCLSNLCSTKSLVLFVGDGVNDAPALAVADVGVAMGEGAALAMEMSDITLMDSNLTKLLYTIKMGARVIVTIQENIFLSVLAKLLVVGLTFAGMMTLLSAIAADVGIMLIVTLNGMKLLPSRKEDSPHAGSGTGISNKQLQKVSKKVQHNKQTASQLQEKYNELPLEGKKQVHDNDNDSGELMVVNDDSNIQTLRHRNHNSDENISNEKINGSSSEVEMV